MAVTGKALWRGICSWWEHRILLEPKDWIQIEVTSRCNAACMYCPRTVYQQHWLNRSMSMDTFRRLLPALPKTRLAYLQGWGEPLLHPELASMIRLAKQAGCVVGTTTNGMLLTQRCLDEFMDAGLDILAFSLAGTTAERNDAARAGAPLASVLEKLKLVQRARQQHGSAAPAVHIAYMLLRSGLDDLENLPELMAEHGVEQCVVSVLDFEPCLELSDQVLAPKNDQQRQELAERLARVQSKGRDYGLVIHVPEFGSDAQANAAIAGPCSENVGNALVVSADGEVSPCVFANVPVRQECPIPALAHGRVTFGNVNRQPLPAIWRTEAYQRFREKLIQGDPHPMCRDCPKRYPTR